MLLNSPPRPCYNTGMQELDDLDRAILALVQGDMQVCEAPYDIWAAELGIDVAVLLERIAALNRAGILRAFKAILRHQKAGITANTMVVWAVPPERVEEVGALLSGQEAITHCYERPGFGEYNVFSMIHGRSEEEVLDLVKRLSESIGIDQYKIYASVQELKKSSMQYF